MARTAQTAIVGVEAGTFADYIPLEGGGVGKLPYAQMVFRGSFVLDGSGTGDTADCRLTFPMPTTNAWQMDAFHLDLEDIAGADIDYDEAIFELNYAPSTRSFGGSNKLDFPLAPGNNITIVNAVLEFRPFFFGGVQGATNVGGIIGPDRQSPFAFRGFYAPDGLSNPVLHISAGAATDIESSTLRFAISFLGYSFEQMSKAELWGQIAP